MDVRTAATLAHLIKDLSLKFLQELQTALNVHHVQPKKFSGQVDHNTQSQTSSKLNQVQEQVNDVKVIIKDNINKVLERGERLDDLIGKTDDLQATADSFQRTSTRVSRKFWWKNMKMMIIIGVVVLIVIILIILLATGVIPS
ncbi:vesicle-associated membrane protein 8 isoform X2 [Brachyhypopomus gauderio]